MPLPVYGKSYISKFCDFALEILLPLKTNFLLLLFFCLFFLNNPFGIAFFKDIFRDTWYYKSTVGYNDLIEYDVKCDVKLKLA